VSAASTGPVAVYWYVDELGSRLYKVLRWPDKRFTQMPASGKTGPGAMHTVRRVLYRLPQVIDEAARGGVVYICEGEKDVLAAEGEFVVAACNPGGAGRGKWKDRFSESLRGASLVVIVVDRDEPGIEHAREVAASVGKVAPVKIVRARVGKDLSDHLEAGKGIEDLEEFELPLARRPAPKPQRREAPAVRHDPSGDPLKGIDPPAYVWLLTGQQVNRDGKTPCPLPGHDDWEGDGGSFCAYPSSEQGWFCFGCSRGGDIFSFGHELWGAMLFPALRQRLVDAVMRAGHHA
jgi:hypothetical protein